MGSSRKSLGCSLARRTARFGQAGYTLVELMMVVTVIGISVLAFAPGISRAMAERRVSMAARELIRIGRRARSDSVGYLRAHVVWITPDSGRVQLLRGPTNSCRYAQWNLIQADCDKTPRGDRCLEDFRVTSWFAGNDPIKIFEQTGTAASPAYVKTSRALCYSSTGIVQHASNIGLAVLNTNLSENNTVEGGFIYTLHSGTDQPTSNDRVHRLLFPLGASPRAWR